MSETSGFDLQRIQLIRKWAIGLSLIAAVTLSLFTTTTWGDGAFHEGVESFGLGSMVIAIVGRAWCSLYIGGRKKAQIVDTGPYSISRNPLYVFSHIGAFGIGAQTGSVTLALLFTLISVVVFHFTTRQEEAWLLNEFGQPYADYMARTPRLGPDFSKWRDNPTLEIRPEFFLTTIRDGLVFLLSIPIFEAIEHLQSMGWLVSLLKLP
ncbi:isoprenylcysteine carboxylmethyltransferase family protein [soil metagenome]